MARATVRACWGVTSLRTAGSVVCGDSGAMVVVGGRDVVVVG